MEQPNTQKEYLQTGVTSYGIYLVIATTVLVAGLLWLLKLNGSPIMTLLIQYYFK